MAAETRAGQAAANCIPQPLDEPRAPQAGQRTITEGAAVVIFPGPDAVFYNRVQVFNRDLSVLALRTFDAQRNKAATDRDVRKAWTREATAAGVALNPADIATGSTPPAIPGVAASPYGRLPGMRVLEALSASGLRSVRFAREVPGVSLLVVNDFDAAAIGAIRDNMAFNGLAGVTDMGAAAAAATGAAAAAAGASPAATWSIGPTGLASSSAPIAPAVISPSHADAVALMHGHKDAGAVAPSKPTAAAAGAAGGAPSSARGSRPFDVVDLDPYGTAAPFLDAAVQAVVDGGMLLVTCTDMAVLAGNHMDVCHGKYGSMPVKARHYHEQALRIVLATIETAANRHKRSIKPQLSLAIDFYVRVIVTVHDSPSLANTTSIRTGSLYQCAACDSFWLWAAGKWNKQLLPEGGAATATTATGAAAAPADAAVDASAAVAAAAAGGDSAAGAAAGAAPAASGAVRGGRKRARIEKRDAATAEEAAAGGATAAAGAGDGDDGDDDMAAAGGGAASNRRQVPAFTTTFDSAAIAHRVPKGAHVSPNIAPPLPPGGRCPDCGRALHVGGPLWLDPIHDKAFAQQVLASAEAEFGEDGLGTAGASSYPSRYYDIHPQTTTADGAAAGGGAATTSAAGDATAAVGGSGAASSSLPSPSSGGVRVVPRPDHDGGSNDIATVAFARKRLVGMLRAAVAELHDVPLYYDLAAVCSRTRMTVIPNAAMVAALTGAGYRVSGSHAAANMIKTDAPPSAVWDVVRCWAKLPGNAPSAARSDSAHSIGHAILSKPIGREFAFPTAAETKALAAKAKATTGKTHLPAPTGEWGPGARASAGKAAAVASGVGRSHASKVTGIGRSLWLQDAAAAAAAGGAAAAGAAAAPAEDADAAAAADGIAAPPPPKRARAGSVTPAGDATSE